MASVAPLNLVLNINTPKYFQNIGTLLHKEFATISAKKTVKNAIPSKSSKRPLENAFASISAKRPKLSKPAGKAFRPSTRSSKLKIASSISIINQNRKLINTNSKENRSSSSSNLPKLSKFSSNNIKPRVSFDTNIEVRPFNKLAPIGDTQKKLLKPDYLCKASSTDKETTKNKPNKKVISSLFNKNPLIPVLQKGDAKSSNQNVFSTISFNQLDISPKLVANIEKLGYATMTVVQQLSIPTILDGKDALIKSQTGSGKTLSYALPIVHKLMVREPKIQRHQELYAVIVVPTRELAIQTYQCLENLCKACVWVVPGYLIGGEKKKAEKARIRKGLNILVATPGRLTDHIDNTCSLELNKVQFLVLDEADRMLEMGYERSITNIINALNKEGSSNLRQTVMLSATLTSAVEKLAGISLNSPQVVDITMEAAGNSLSDEFLVTPQNLTHNFMVVPMKVRLVSLAAFIIEKCKFSDEKKILVFMTTQDMVDYHTSLFAHILSRLGRKRRSTLEKNARRILEGEKPNENNSEDEEEDIDVDYEDDIHFMKLHGNMTQPERTAVFKSFQESSSGVLLCTDVASRGLDLPRVNWIVQFNPAFTTSDYVHRVGRTARANMKGSAILFVSPSETTFVTMLEEHGVSFTEIRMENVLKTLMASPLYNEEEKVPRNMEIAATRLQDKFEGVVLNDKIMHEMAVLGYVSYIRSYAAIPKIAREFFSFKLLHLGHCAKSFALRDPPAVLGAKGTKSFIKGESNFREERKVRNDRDKEKEQKLFNRNAPVSEFDSGFEGLKQEAKLRRNMKQVKGRKAFTKKTKNKR